MDRKLATLTSKTLDAISGHTDALLDGSLTADAFRQRMARTLIEHQGASFMIGADTKKLTLADQRAITDANKFHLGKLDGFVQDIKNGRYKNSPDGLKARAAMYAGANKEMYARGQTRGMALPYYPAQGTQCLTNCGCAWEIQQTERGIDAYWRRAKNDSCTTCITRERESSPYQIALS